LALGGGWPRSAAGLVSLTFHPRPGGVRRVKTPDARLAVAASALWDHVRVLRKVNVAQCETQLLYERGTFQTTYHDLTEPLDACVIGASVFETNAGYTRGPYHFHDGVEEWMYVVSGQPVLRDPSGQRGLEPGTLVAFQAGPDGAHTFDGPGRVVMFSVGARGWGEAFTSVYLDADTIRGKPGGQFRRTAALEIWAEPAVVAVPPAPAGPCPQIDLRSLPADNAHLAERLHAQTWAPTLYELGSSETTGPYHYDWCREHWALVLGGAPTLRHPGGQDVMVARRHCLFYRGRGRRPSVPQPCRRAGPAADLLGARDRAVGRGLSRRRHLRAPRSRAGGIPLSPQRPAL